MARSPNASSKEPVSSTSSIGGISLAQEDGHAPARLAAGRAPGESGVSVLSARFLHGAHLSGTTREHLVCFQMSSGVPIECRIGGKRLWHTPRAGSLAICPAGVDCAADAAGSVVELLVTINPGQLALAAAEELALDARLNERLSGDDPDLLAEARRLSLEAAAGFPNGPLYWNEVAAQFVERLLSSHTRALDDQTRGGLGSDVLGRIREYIAAHLDEPIGVAALARIATRSEFHFSRVFARSVGMTPHRYVVHLRLQRAVELVRGGRFDLGTIAAKTGFADQSHLSRWIRRVHGVSLSGLNPRPATKSRNLHDTERPPP